MNSKVRSNAATVAAAMSWSELESVAKNLSSWVDTKLMREIGPTNSRATFRSFQESPTSTVATVEEANASRVVLYRDNHAWCPYCQKVWLWLEEKRVPYRVEKVTMFCYGEKERWYKRLVPSGMLPAVALDGAIITESDDILMTLENEFGALGKGMTNPKVVALRRMERQLFGVWCQWLCYPARSSREEERNQKHFEHYAQIVDSTLGKTSGPYFLGDELCTADVIFTPYIERMAASLFYYKGFDIKGKYSNIHKWFAAMETRETYLGTQSDYHTHAHDLPPQMGGCYSNNSKQANASLIDLGLFSDEKVPEVSHAEPEYAVQEALLRVIKHHETILLINPHKTKKLDLALRAALTNMVTGSEDCIPPSGTDQGLRYIRDRISVPRDMSIYAGRRLRSALEATAQLDGGNNSPHTIPVKHRRDQGCAPFREARDMHAGSGKSGKFKNERKGCGAM